MKCKSKEEFKQTAIEKQVLLHSIAEVLREVARIAASAAAPNEELEVGRNSAARPRPDGAAPWPKAMDRGEKGITDTSFLCYSEADFPLVAWAAANLISETRATPHTDQDSERAEESHIDNAEVPPTRRNLATVFGEAAAARSAGGRSVIMGSKDPTTSMEKGET